MESTFQQALSLQKAGRFDEAEPLYLQAADWKPEWALGNLGVIYRTTGRLAEAEAVLRRALAAAPGNLPVRHSLGMTLLQLGQYAEGWRHYEARHQLTPPIAAPLPLWRGESLAGRRIVVVGEQGLGDQILLSRFIPLLAGRAGEVVLVTSRSLVRLFGHLPARVLYPEDWEEIGGDCWIPLGSVPRWLEAGPRDAPAPTLPSFSAGGACSGVGLMLQGAAGNANNPRRLPDPAVARAIRGLTDFTDLSPAATGAADFADTAKIVAGLERVVTVDTSVAHLAGAMGKPCWILMARPAIDWYANWHDDRTPWYPSVRLLRQPTPGAWVSVLLALDAALKTPL